MEAVGLMSVAMETCTKSCGTSSPVSFIMDCESCHTDSCDSSVPSRQNGVESDHKVESNDACNSPGTVNKADIHETDTCKLTAINDLDSDDESSKDVDNDDAAGKSTVQHDSSVCSLSENSTSSIDCSDKSSNGEKSNIGDADVSDTSSFSPIIIEDQSCSDVLSAADEKKSYNTCSSVVKSPHGTVVISGVSSAHAIPAVSISNCNLSSELHAPVLVKSDKRDAAVSGVRPVAKLLQDTGLLLASQKVFKYLVQIQRQKVERSKSSVDAADIQLFDKLKSSYNGIVERNVDFALKPFNRCVCGFRTESANVMNWHQQCGKWGPGKCCVCNGEYSYRSRSMFERHMKSAHKLSAQSSGRPLQNPCQTCLIDFNSKCLLNQHETKCRRQFALSQNLIPLASHEDIPLKYPTSSQGKSDVTVLVSLPTVPSHNRNPGAILPTATVLPTGLNTSGTLLRNSPVNTQPVTSSRLTKPLSLPNSMSATKLVEIGGKLYSIQSEELSKGGTQLPLSPASSISSDKKGTLKYQKCPFCPGLVKDETALKVHLKVIHGYHSNGALATDYAYCWICHDSMPLNVKDLLSHIAEKHDITMATMLITRRCSLCASVPTLRNISAFEYHMLSVHSELFRTPEKLWHAIDNTVIRPCQHMTYSDDGTLQCRRCLSNFISRAFLCRHSFLSHNGQPCNCEDCPVLVQSKKRSAAADSSVVTISDDEDEITTKRPCQSLDMKTSLSNSESKINIDRDDSIMEKVEVLEIDGETVLIVQEADD